MVIWPLSNRLIKPNFYFGYAPVSYSLNWCGQRELHLTDSSVNSLFLESITSNRVCRGFCFRRRERNLKMLRTVYGDFWRGHDFNNEWVDEWSELRRHPLSLLLLSVRAERTSAVLFSDIVRTVLTVLHHHQEHYPAKAVSNTNLAMHLGAIAQWISRLHAWVRPIINALVSEVHSAFFRAVELQYSDCRRTPSATERMLGYLSHGRKKHNIRFSVLWFEKHFASDCSHCWSSLERRILLQDLLSSISLLIENYLYY